MNLSVDLFFRPEDRARWSVAVDATAARLVFLGDSAVGLHWYGADGRARAVQMLRQAADELEAAP